MDGDMWQGCIMWQGVGACGRVWAHVAGDGGLSQWIGVYGRGVGTYGRTWGHVAGCGGMWHGVVACGRVWGHVVGGRGM